MTDELTDDELRAMASHRGLKLIRSRRRKPGAGDYGKFGLQDADGKALLGVGVQGLTASAADVASYLRSDTLATWKQSAATTPRQVQKGPAKSLPRTETEPFSSRRPRDLASRSKPAQTSAKAQLAVQAPQAPTPAARTSSADQPDKKRLPEPTLLVRIGKISDAPLLESLMPALAKATAIEGRITQLLRAGGGFAIAELGSPVGCCFWTPIPMIQYGLVGRIGLLWVIEGHRRKGIGTKLLLAAEQALASKGCSRIEVMSDIEIKNSHNFFRTLKFEQTSYRFVRDIASR